jgi:hypothetical protein
MKGPPFLARARRKDKISSSQRNKEVLGRQEMKKPAYLEKDEMELAKSLENEEWISDLTKEQKSNTRNMPLIRNQKF